MHSVYRKEFRKTTESEGILPNLSFSASLSSLESVTGWSMMLLLFPSAIFLLPRSGIPERDRRAGMPQYVLTGQ